MKTKNLFLSLFLIIPQRRPEMTLNTHTVSVHFNAFAGDEVTRL